MCVIKGTEMTVDLIFERRIIQPLLFFVSASDGQRTEKTLTQAVTQS